MEALRDLLKIIYFIQVLWTLVIFKGRKYYFTSVSGGKVWQIKNVICQNIMIVSDGATVNVSELVRHWQSTNAGN